MNEKHKLLLHPREAMGLLYYRNWWGILGPCTKHPPVLRIPESVPFLLHRDPITPILLVYLHWLPVAFRIDFKMAILTHRCLNHLAPQYLLELLCDRPNRAVRNIYVLNRCLVVNALASTAHKSALLILKRVLA